MATGYTNSTSSLCLRVRGGSTQPSGTEGLIWANTENEITAWTVSPTKPAAPSEGFLWIKNETENEINVLKKNCLFVYPSNCKLYTGGTWVAVDAYIFRNSQWVQFGFNRYYLYSEGDEYTAVTGGWVLATDGWPSHGDTLEKNSDSMTFSTSAEQGAHYSLGFLHPKKRISLKNYNSLKVEFASAENDADGCVIVTTTNKYNVLSSFDPDPAMAASSDIIRDGKGVVSVDISSLTGSYYFGPAFGNSDSATLVIKHIWLE